jgi:hypothetical protein
VEKPDKNGDWLKGAAFSRSRVPVVALWAETHKRSGVPIFETLCFLLSIVYYFAMNASTSCFVGIEACAPSRVTLIAATAFAYLAASFSELPFASP